MQVEVTSVETQTDSDYEIFDRDMYEMNGLHPFYGTPLEPTPEEKARREREDNLRSYVSGKGHYSNVIRN